MKKVRSILGIILVLTMMVAFSISAFAIDVESSTVIVKPATNGSSYESHNILSVNRSDDGASVSYSVNSQYERVLRELIPTGDIVDYISGLSGKELQQFADRLYQKIKTAGINAEYTATSTDGQAVFDGISPGYTLIGQTAAGENEPFSVVLLDTAFDRDTIYVTPKTETPSVEKKVLEKSDSIQADGTWQDAADYDAGDQVAFQITGTLPENLLSYDRYAIKFHDTLSSAFTYNNDATIYAVMGPGADNMIECTELFTIQSSGSNLTFGCDNILQHETTMNAKSFLIKYTAKLSMTPVLGAAGNPNTVYMEYSRNPHGTENGQTAPDKVTVFSYQVKVDKVNEQQQPLNGAGFALYKYIAEQSAYKLVGEAKYSGTEFVFQGLDAGQYKLEEVQTPSGYNSIAPIEFKVEAVYDTKSADPVLTDLVAKKLTGESITGSDQMFSVDLANGRLSTKIVNKTGTELPSTGGAGTILLYVLGGGLVVTGGLILLLKKRKKTTKHR